MTDVSPFTLSEEQRLTMSRALGERTGKDILPEEIEIIHPWIFHNDPYYDDEVDAYRLPLPIEAECWTCIPLKESPFKTKDPTILGPMVEKLNREYNED